MSETTTDHQKIRNWAEQHGGKPAAVEGTGRGGDDAGIIRLMFPKARQSESDDLVEISWDEFFQKFDDEHLALLYEPDSMFSKLVDRDTH